MSSVYRSENRLPNGYSDSWVDSPTVTQKWESTLNMFIVVFTPSPATCPDSYKSLTLETPSLNIHKISPLSMWNNMFLIYICGFFVTQTDWFTFIFLVLYPDSWNFCPSSAQKISPKKSSGTYSNTQPYTHTRDILHHYQWLCSSLNPAGMLWYPEVKLLDSVSVTPACSCLQPVGGKDRSWLSGEPIRAAAFHTPPL